ncbi:RHS repeat-associated core domain-containing protein [Pseudomonas soli]|uniref:RHS repeat-associated core domain-containing protein n=1 Tax=Pseudomonas soli TaxID=1306993 RepID=UPI0037F1F56F
MSNPHLLAADKQKTPLSGTGFSSRCHTPYGALPSHDGPVVAYCGEPRDSGMDRYHLGNGHRVYNPVLMRFQSSDGLSPFGKGGINAYGYCAGDPVNYSDPSGRSPLRKLSNLPAQTPTKPPVLTQPLISDRPAVNVFTATASAVVLSGAAVRTVDDVTKRLTLPADQYVPMTRSREIANTMFAVIGVAGMYLHASETGPVEYSTSDQVMMGVSMGATGLLLWETVVDSYIRIDPTVVSWRRVMAHTAYQLSGGRLIMRGLSTIGSFLREGYEPIPGQNHTLRQLEID